MIVGGRRINSCLTLAVMSSGAQITTIEGLGTPSSLHPLQASFVKCDGFQCGSCKAMQNPQFHDRANQEAAWQAAVQVSGVDFSSAAPLSAVS